MGRSERHAGRSETGVVVATVVKLSAVVVVVAVVTIVEAKEEEVEEEGEEVGDEVEDVVATVVVVGMAVVIVWQLFPGIHDICAGTAKRGSTEGGAQKPGATSWPE